MKSSLLVAALGLYSVDAHICMWNPPQRGGAFELTIPGQSICYLKQGPCGNVPSAEPLATLKGGQEFDILFQQNLNHFFVEEPGRLQADFAEVADPSEDDFYELGQPINDWNGMNMITQTNFSIRVTVPNIDCDHCVLRMRYISQNPTEDHGGSPTFHQCADVKVTKSSDVSHTKPSATPSHFTSGNDCCAPKQFTLEGYETGSGWRNPTKMKFYFDAVNELFRIDTDSGNGETAKDGKFRMYNDFKSGIEYYYNAATDYCDLYGLNIWADWCYGSVNSQIYSQSVRVGNQVADVWKMDGNDFYWSNIRSSCIPVSKTRSTTGEATYYYNMNTNLPSDYFELPQACLDAAKDLGTRALKARPVEHSHFGE